MKTLAKPYRAAQWVNSPVVIDVCVPDSEVIDGSIVGRGVRSCCYCVFGELRGDGAVRLGGRTGELDGFIEKRDLVHRPGTLRCS